MNLGDIRFDILNLIVDFMYKGEINVPLEQLPSVLKAATALKIEALIGQARELLKEVSEIKEDSIVEIELENAEDLIEDFFGNQVDLVADSPMINNREEADVVANSHGDELSEIHNALQLQLSEDEGILPTHDAQENPDDTTGMETRDRPSVKRKKSLKDYSASEVSEQQPRKSLRLAAVKTKNNRNDDEKEVNEEDSLDDSSSISTDSTAFSDGESDNGEGCSTTLPLRKSVARKPKSSAASSSKGDVLTMKPFKCKKCGLSYKQKVSLTRHLKSPCGNEKNVSLFSCSKCNNYRTNRKDNFRDHLKNIHKMNSSQLAECGAGYVLPFTCWVCKRTCKNADRLERHMKFHDEENEPYFPCFLCDYRCSTNSQRRGHLIDIHVVDPLNLADHRAGHLLQC